MRIRGSIEGERAAAGLNVGIVGATGLVGEKMRALLAERDFPVASLRLFASERSRGRVLRWKGERVEVEGAADADFSGLDVVFFSAGGETARALAPRVAAVGALVIDNSSAWRADPEVPLVVSEVNSEALDRIPRGIVANPNCTTMVVMPLLAPLHREAGLIRLVASTYQAASGAGLAGIEELAGQIEAAGARSRALAESGSAIDFPTPSQWPVPLAYNAVPLNYTVGDDGYTDEERKFRDESRKILGIPELPVAATCVRIGAFTGHALSVHAEFERPIEPTRARALLGAEPGVQLVEVPTPLAAAGEDDVLVGRIRADPTVRHGLVFYAAGDNLRKGAALNAVQIAEVWNARLPKAVDGI